MELLLIRHAEPMRVENSVGPADPSLHERGRHQADLLASWLRAGGSADRLDAIWTSPLRRARETAQPSATAFDLTPALEDGLAEWDRAAPEYIPLEELKAAGDDRWQALVSGEYFASTVDPDTFRAGVVDAVEAIIGAHPGQRVAVFCHGGVINMYLSWILALPPRNFFLPRYTGINRIEAARAGPRSIATINETAHLRTGPIF